ncbi:hypothetical protein IAU60_006868 [Kwoniella sp. DSM 27419]
MSTPPPSPTYARVTSLSHWTTFFHPTEGTFRLPHDLGDTIQHLDVDLRFVQQDTVPPAQVKALPIHLPSVCRLTLRGGEFVQDDETRMDALSEVLMAINPIEVHWVNASTDPYEQLSFSTHLIHPAIIAAGQTWSERSGSLLKLVVQGGFPCPNLTAPTPFSLTPATTPCPSPGPTKTTFGSLTMSRPASPEVNRGNLSRSHTTSSSYKSSLPALSANRPKIGDETKVKARQERQRLAEYTLQPRFEYAFGTWAVEDLRWRLDGRYTPKCIVTILTHFFRAIGSSFPSASLKTHIDLPSAITFTSVPKGVIQELRSLLDTLQMDDEVRTYLQDTVFVTLDRRDCPAARLWDGGVDVDADAECTELSEDDEIAAPSNAHSAQRHRQGRRFKAELLLLQDIGGTSFEVVSLPELLGVPSDLSTRAADHSLGVPAHNGLGLGAATATASPAISDCSVLPGESEATEDTDEALTPELGASPRVHPAASIRSLETQTKNVQAHHGDVEDMVASLVLE